MAALEQYPDMEVVATVVGEASATKTQEEITKILPSLTEVDAVLTQGGETLMARRRHLSRPTRWACL